MMQSVRTWIAFGFLALGFGYILALAMTPVIFAALWLATRVAVALQ